MQNPAANGAWQNGPNMLMVHGGTAILALLLLGALIPLHILRAWRARKNLVSGSLMATFNAILIATAFALYYLCSETLRPWISWTHIVAGLALALRLPVHIWLRRRQTG